MNVKHLRHRQCSVAPTVVLEYNTEVQRVKFLNDFRLCSGGQPCQLVLLPRRSPGTGLHTSVCQSCTCLRYPPRRLRMFFLRGLTTGPCQWALIPNKWTQQQPCLSMQPIPYPWGWRGEGNLYPQAPKTTAQRSKMKSAIGTPGEEFHSQRNWLPPKGNSLQPNNDHGLGS